MKYNFKNIKFIGVFLIFTTLSGACLIGCAKVEKVPPRTEGAYSKSFQLPVPERLTTEEREYIEGIQEEYDKNAN